MQIFFVLYFSIENKAMIVCSNCLFFKQYQCVTLRPH